jgi:hypothetical protein
VMKVSCNDTIYSNMFIAYSIALVVCDQQLLCSATFHFDNITAFEIENICELISATYEIQ